MKNNILFKDEIDDDEDAGRFSMGQTKWVSDWLC